MGFIYQEANAYGVEALVALERHYTPTEEKYCTAVTEAVRICDTYGIPERELVPQVRHIAAAEEYLLEHLSEDEETLQFLFTPLSGSNTCLAWFLVWDYVRPGGEKAYKYTGHTPQQRLRDIISAVGQYQEDPLPPPQQLNTGDYTPIAVEVTCDHDHTTRTETPATCTEDGSVTVVCDDCDEVLSTETLPATGHSTVVKNAKDATCTEPGYTAIRSAPSAARPARPARSSPPPATATRTASVPSAAPPIPTPTAAAIPAMRPPTAPTPLTEPPWACG